jgi:hypothetical protein
MRWLQVMVVKSYEAINRLRQAAQAANMPIPSMLSYTLIQVCWRGTCLLSTMIVLGISTEHM